MVKCSQSTAHLKCAQSSVHCPSRPVQFPASCLSHPHYTAGTGVCCNRSRCTCARCTGSSPRGGSSDTLTRPSSGKTSCTCAPTCTWTWRRPCSWRESAAYRESSLKLNHNTILAQLFPSLSKSAAYPELSLKIKLQYNLAPLFWSSSESDAYRELSLKLNDKII